MEMPGHDPGNRGFPVIAVVDVNLALGEDNHVVLPVEVKNVDREAQVERPLAIVKSNPSAHPRQQTETEHGWFGLRTSSICGADDSRPRGVTTYITSKTQSSDPFRASSSARSASPSASRLSASTMKTRN